MPSLVFRLSLCPRVPSVVKCRGMAGVLERIGKLPALRELRQLVESRGAADVVGCAGSGPAAVAAWLALGVRTHALVVCAGAEEAEEFAEDVNLFHDGLACHFPPLEVLPGDVERPSDAILRARLSVLRHLAFGDTGEHGDQATDVDFLEPTPRTRIVCTAVTALLQPTASPDDLRQGSLSVAVGDEAEPGRLVEWLVDNGYQSAPQVQLSGQYRLRGGILDVYSHGAPEPVRVEFFGDRVDSIRTFDPFSQLSTGRIQRCQVTVPERQAGDEERRGRQPARLPGAGRRRPDRRPRAALAPRGDRLRADRAAGAAAPAGGGGPGAGAAAARALRRGRRGCRPHRLHAARFLRPGAGLDAGRAGARLPRIRRHARLLLQPRRGGALRRAAEGQRVRGARARADRGRPAQPRGALPGGRAGADPPPPPLPPLPPEAPHQPHAGRPAGGRRRGAGGRRAGRPHPARHRQVPRHQALGARGPHARAPGDRVRGQGARLRPRRPHRDGAPVHRRRRAPAGAEQAARGDAGRRPRGAPRRPSRTWPPSCWNCRPSARRRPASPPRPTASGSASSSPSSPTRRPTTSSAPSRTSSATCRRRGRWTA